MPPINTFQQQVPAKPKQSDLVRLLKPNPDLQNSPADIIPGKQAIPDLDEDYLSEELVRTLRQCIQDRESFGFEYKRRYDDESYYGVKDEFFNNWPWPGSSNFIEPITATLVDVGYTHIHAAMFRDRLKTVGVSGVGKEDRPYAPLISHVMNWEVGVDSNMFETQISNSFRTLQKGTGFVKTWVDYGDNFKIRNASVPLQLVYKPIRKSGCQRQDTWFTHQLIPLDETDWKFRQGIRINGKPVYKHLDLIMPGWGAGEAFSAEDSQLVQSQITGLDISGSDKRDLRYMVETHITHYPKGKFKALELVVWWSPKHGMIHRYIQNVDLIRPLSDYYVYMNPGYAYHRSLPEILRDIQEKANYTDKQVTDAADKAISAPGYIEEQSGFDPNAHVRVPSGMYEVKKGTKITFEQPNMASLIERGNMIDKLWDKAKTRSGFTDIFQGLEGPRSGTLGGDKIRLNKAENRFRTVLDTFGIGWSNTCKIIYELTDRNIPRKKLIKILGSSDYTNIEQLFPQNDEKQFGIGFEAQVNFFLAGKTQQEIDEENIETNTFLDMTINTFALNGQKQIIDKGVLWKAMKAKADIIGFEDYERMVPRPPEADMMSVDEVLQRIESNEVQIQPSPLMDSVTLEFYRFRIQAFKLTERYKNYDKRQRIELERYLAKLDSIGIGQNIARFQNQAKNDPMAASALDEVMQRLGGPGNAPPGLLQ